MSPDYLVDQLFQMTSAEEEGGQRLRWDETPQGGYWTTINGVELLLGEWYYMAFLALWRDGKGVQVWEPMIHVSRAPIRSLLIGAGKQCAGATEPRRSKVIGAIPAKSEYEKVDFRDETVREGLFRAVVFGSVAEER